MHTADVVIGADLMTPVTDRLAGARLQITGANRSSSGIERETACRC